MPIGAYAPAWINIPLTRPGPVIWGQEDESCNDTTQAIPAHMEQPTTPALPVASIFTASLLVLTGAVIIAMIYQFFNSRSSGHEQSAGAVEEDDEEGVIDIALADPVADNQEGAAIALEIQLRDEEELIAVVQEEIGLMLDMRLHSILRKAVHLRTPLERLTVDAWVEQQARL